MPAGRASTIGCMSEVRGAKTGGWGGPWIDLEPKPARVNHVEGCWRDRPGMLSQRCVYWVRQILRGWRPSRRISGEGYYAAAEWYGVWLWEYLHVLFPLLNALERTQFAVATRPGERLRREVGLGWTRAETTMDALLLRWPVPAGFDVTNVDVVMLAEAPGMPVAMAGQVRHPHAVGDDELLVMISLEEVLAEACGQVPMGVTLAEARGDAVCRFTA